MKSNNKLIKNRKKLEYLLNQRSFIIPSFEIYGSVSGLYDLGPLGCAIKNNIISHWRNSFIVQENMFEIECSQLTPERVLKTSGHVDKFTDVLIKDKKGNTYRADKLLEDLIDYMIEHRDYSQDEINELQIIRNKADSYSCEDLDELLRHRFINDLMFYFEDSEIEFDNCSDFNLMFKTTIGPYTDNSNNNSNDNTNNNTTYLRPETAQGIFVNFPRLLAFNENKMPVVCAQIGKSFRNEIAPRNGLLRVREFTMAEIEHFVNPQRKEHFSFTTCNLEIVTLFPKENQIKQTSSSINTVDMTLESAVKSNIINNETLAYYIYKTQKFLLDIGIKKEYLRFRQHLDNEMAHYATDCWDAEILTSYGWIECVGIADRACYDLNAHAKATKTRMIVTEPLEKPIIEEITEIKLNKKLMFPAFGIVIGKHNCIPMFEQLQLDLENDLEIAKTVVKQLEKKKQFEYNFKGVSLIITDKMINVKIKQKNITTIKYTPSVIEPSFGIGRIMYSLLEHSFHIPTSDPDRVSLRFNSLIAPYKYAIMPLIQKNKDMNQYCHNIIKQLKSKNIICHYDNSSASIGKRYSRFDEIGVPFTITVDHNTCAENDKLFNSVTIRDRDSRLQCRVLIKELLDILEDLIIGKITFESLIEEELNAMDEMILEE